MGFCASATAVFEQLILTTSLRAHSATVVLIICAGKHSLDIFGAPLSASRICTADSHIATWGYD